MIDSYDTFNNSRNRVYGIDARKHELKNGRKPDLFNAIRSVGKYNALGCQMYLGARNIFAFSAPAGPYTGLYPAKCP